MKYLIILLLGLIVGAGAAVFLLGTPRAKSLEIHRGQSSSLSITVLLKSFSPRFFRTWARLLFISPE
jgi:hypothetical protein